ncbi:hypothetical protein WJX73_010584 [Symbiochloris irregularis]|uniref:Endoplasmic reticulum-Golgi intermediate compartment protein 3 n=1 Tax=Symbiochloris irregularis TaxID=706552 RepID=A0AAW1Q1P1_9CHLO
MKLGKLKSISAYARAESHLIQQTNYGAIVTLFGVCLAIALFTSEAVEHFRPYTLTTMGVDTVRDQHLYVEFNMSFPALPCQALSLDASDVSGILGGDYSMAKNGELHKIRLAQDGGRLAVEEYVAPRHYGFALRKPRAEVEALNAAFRANEGCLVLGWLRLQRVAGNMHVSVHMDDYIMLERAQSAISAALGSRPVNHVVNGLFMPEEGVGVNVSHHIHRMAFGTHKADEHPEIINPLDGTHRIVTEKTGIFKYFLKIVPTEYIKLGGHKLQTNQYSVTEYDSPAHPEQLQLPSVWFVYDMSPVTVVMAQTRRSILHLLTRFCAVVGGVFAVTGMLDKAVHKLVTSVLK